MVDVTVLPGYVAVILLFLGPPGRTWPTCSPWVSKAVGGRR